MQFTFVVQTKVSIKERQVMITININVESAVMRGVCCNLYCDIYTSLATLLVCYVDVEATTLTDGSNKVTCVSRCSEQAGRQGVE